MRQEKEEGTVENRQGWAIGHLMAFLKRRDMYDWEEVHG